MNLPKYTGYPSIDRAHLKGISFAKLHPPIFPLSLLEAFSRINARDMNAVAIERDGKLYSRHELKGDVLAVARSLCRIGIAEGRTLTIATPNLYEGIVLTMAANAVGIKVGYANDVGPSEQVLDQLAKELIHYESVAVAVYNRNRDFAERLLARAPKLRKVIIIHPDPALEADQNGIYDGPVVDYEYLHYNFGDEDYFRHRLRRNRLSKKEAFYLQTSGSTSGRPKGLIFTNEAVFASLMYAKNSTGTNTHDKSVRSVLCILPYRLPYGWMTIFVNLLGGNRVELATGATPEDIGNYYQLRPSYIYGTPLIFRNFMDRTPKGIDLSFLKAFFCSGFAISEEWYQEGIAYLEAHNSKAEIRNNYGIGEALCIGTASDGVPHRAGTSGKFYVGPEWIIVDEKLREVKYGEIGEALLRSKSLFKGYFKDGEATERAFVNYKGKLWYRSGDYVSLSRDGYVTFHGRKKRFYQPLGATDKVNCETIERALLKNAGIIRECAVVIYSPSGSYETSKAFVVTNQGYAATPELKNELFDKLREDLLPFQLPDDIVFLPSLPIMKSGKIDYTKLQAMCSSTSTSTAP